MAALPTIETQAKVASDAAQSFVEAYYQALNNHLPLAPFYSTASPLLTAASPSLPDISVNGLALPRPAAVSAYEDLLSAQGRPVRYEVASWDAQPVNPDYRLGLPEAPAGPGSARALREGERLSLAVQVSGTVRYGPAGEEGASGAGEAVVKGFSEAWLLVPHWEAWGRGAPRGARKWVVASQNFRAF